jgi:nitrate reductase delta subunit
MRPAPAVWDRLADLIEYPDGCYVGAIDACVEATAGSDLAAPLQRFRSAMADAGVAAAQERYVEAFDFDPACTLDIGWHLLRDAPERGALLANLRGDLANAVVDERGELPDHLPALLRLIAREDESRGAALAGFIAPAVAGVHERLRARANPYGDILEAIERLLAALQQSEARP